MEREERWKREAERWTEKRWRRREREGVSKAEELYRAEKLVVDAHLALIDVRGWPVAPDPIDRHHIERRHCSRCRGSGRCTGGSRAQHHPSAPRKIADRKRTGRGARASKRRPSRCPTARNLTANCQGTARIHAPWHSLQGAGNSLFHSSMTLMGESQKESRKSLAPNDKTLCVPVSRRAI